jgi:hypothetical protein
LKTPIFGFVLLIGPLLALAQTPANHNAASGVEVTKFSWKKYKHRPSTARVHEPEYTVTQAGSNELPRQAPADQNSVEGQSGDLRAAEQQAKRDFVYGKDRVLYRYVVSLRNVGSKTIKMILWEYQFTDPAYPENPTRLQFRCNVNINPDRSKRVEAFTATPPVRVVSAQSAGKLLEEKIVINRIEYMDGTNWRNPDWSARHSWTTERQRLESPCVAIKTN